MLFDLDDMAQGIVQRGMLGLPLGEQLTGHCRRIHDAGFPMKRVMMGMNTLHPRYGMHAFVWRPDTEGVTYLPRERDIIERRPYLGSPVHVMRTRGMLELRRRLDRDDGEDFELFQELRAEGLTDYAAHFVPFDPAEAAKLAHGVNHMAPPGLDGVFFSCATDRPDGFDDAQLDLVLKTLPYLALAVKARLTYDVAHTVVETYLGDDAGHRVLTGAIQRGSTELIRAVIWFADLRGFTQLADRLPAPALITTLNDYLDVMAAPIRDHRGQILKFMGDGLLATFDLSGRDAARACRDALDAALALRQRFAQVNVERATADCPVMAFGLALHLGDVHYGNIGAADRLDFTVVGPAVNEASRMQALCRPLGRDILLSRTLRDVLGDDGRLETLGHHTLRGVGEAVELFALEP